MNTRLLRLSLLSAPFVVLTSVCAQQPWHHEKLLSQVYDVAATPYYVWISGRGQVAYYTSPTQASPKDVWLNHENLTAWPGPGCINAGPRGISETGHVVYEASRRDASGRLALGVFVDQRKWWEQVYGTGTNMELHVHEGGVEDQRLPLYTLWEYPYGNNRFVYHGNRLVQAGILSGRTHIGGAYINGAGRIAWSGSGDETGVRNHVFVDDYPLSRNVIGPNYDAGAWSINRRGDVVWLCQNLDGYTDFFINDVNYSRSRFGNTGRNYSAFPAAMNDKGDVVWSARDPSVAYSYPDVFKNHQNLSLAVYGDIPRGAFPMGISNTGQAVWIGFREGLESRNTIFKDTTDISNPVLGPTCTPTDTPQIDAWGRVMWWAWGPQFNGWKRTFVDSLDLSADALGDDVWNYTCKGVKIGPNGHVFWIAVDLRTNLADVWLCTPVPEPSGIATVGLMTVWLASRRSRRA